MFKFWSSIKKEYLQLINDRIGLLLMFIMPLLLVVVVTIIQNSAYEIVNKKKISILIINKDTGEKGKDLIKLIDESYVFDMEIDNSIPNDNISKELLNRGKHTVLLIPEDFSSKLYSNTKGVSQIMMSDMGLLDKKVPMNSLKNSSPLYFYYDPILQENYCSSLTNMIYSFLDAIETSLMLDSFYANMGIDNNTDELKDLILNNKIKIDLVPASTNNYEVMPNSTQHNVPAWTIFAMFFIVVSLGGNMVKERVNGSFVRLKTMPTNFSLVLISKMIIYLIVALLQVTVIFSVGILVFPYINLNQLVLPSNISAFIFFVFLCSLSAVSYAFMIGSLLKTQEQANGFGAVSVIILAAIGGIWLPVFVMPDYIQSISAFSPLQWCMQGFYILFLKGGNWTELFKVILSLSFFIIFCQLVSFYKLKIERII